MTSARCLLCRTNPRTGANIDPERAYQPSQMSRFLENLEPNLVRTSPATAELVGSWLEENMISFQHMAKSLAEHIPAVLTLPVAFSPGASKNGIAATLEDIAMRLHCEHHVTFAPVMPKSSSSRPSLGSVLVQSVQGFSKEFNVSQELPAAAHGKYAAQKMSILMFTATFVSAIWHGYLARQLAARLRVMRDASILIAFYVRGWLRRRDQRTAVKQEQSPTESVAPQAGALNWGVNRRMALARLRAARMRDERTRQLKQLARMSSNENNGDELENSDTMFALLIIASYVQCWLNYRASARATSRRQAVEEEAAAAVAEEERLKKASMETIAITPELHQAKQHLRNRRLERPPTEVVIYFQ